MKPLVTAALLFMSLTSVPPVSADVIELRTGQRVEGTFKGADDSAVKIEIDGRIMTFAPARGAGDLLRLGAGMAPAALPSNAMRRSGRSTGCDRLRAPE